MQLDIQISRESDGLLRVVALPKPDDWGEQYGSIVVVNDSTPESAANAVGRAVLSLISFPERALEAGANTLGLGEPAPPAVVEPLRAKAETADGIRTLLERAIRFNESVWLVYTDSAGVRTERMIEPLAIKTARYVTQPDQDYIEALDTEKGQRRGFRLDRIKRVEL